MDKELREKWGEGEVYGEDISWWRKEKTETKTEGLRKVTGDGEEKDRLARQAELFGDDFTPSINQLSPLLSLLPLPVAWHGPEGVVALSHAL